jgi:hypothetical protein
MGDASKDNGKIAICMARANTLGKTGAIMRASILMIKK